MPRTETLQTNFSGGELAPELLLRQDTDQYRSGAKSLRNMRCLVGGGVTRKPGSLWQATLGQSCRAESFIVNQTTRYVVLFSAGMMSAYLQNVDSGTLTASGSVTGAAWTGTIWQDMDVVQSGNTMFLVHNDMMIQVLTRTAVATWTVASFAYYVGPASRPEQPYLKIAAPTMTLTCSDVTGSITLTVSGATAYFVAGHVGTYIRYHKKACLITAVAADGLSCTATVIERLPETYSLTVGASDNFSVGEVVTGSSTGAKAKITAVPDGTHVTVILTEKLIAFTTSDTLVGPQASTTISAVSTTTNGAVTDWDEQLLSGVNGYPSCVNLHRNRLLFGGAPAAPDYLIGSALNNLYNFCVGTGADGDAILESVGDSQASEIVQFYSAENLIVLTDHGPYYVPETKTSPFVPSSMSFFPFGSPWPITPSCKAHGFDGGALFVSESLIVKARPNANVFSSWDADDDVGVVSNHLVSNPTRMTVVSNFNNKTERYAVFVNDDGTLAVLQLVEQQKIRNITGWDTNGTYESVVGIGRFLYATSRRSVNGQEQYFLELFDQEITLDLATQYDSTTSMAAGIAALYGSTEVYVVKGDYSLGTYPLAIATVPAGPFTVGLFFDTEIETLPPVVEGQGTSKAGDLMRIMETLVFVQGSARFSQDGNTLAARQLSEDVEDVPQLLDGAQRFQGAGWQRQPTNVITQPDPLPLTILAIKTKVAF